MKHIKNRTIQPILLALVCLGFLLLASCGPSAAPDTTKAADPGKADSPQAPVTEISNTLALMGLDGMEGNPEAPDFSLGALDNKTLRLSDFRGKWVLLNFWATWCPPCRAEMPSMQTMYTAFAPKGLVLLAVSSGEETGTVQEFISQNGYSFPVLLDPDGTVGGQYGVQAIPTTYLINPEGLVVGGKTGSHDWNSPGVSQGLDSLLKP